MSRNTPETRFNKLETALRKNSINKRLIQCSNGGRALFALNNHNSAQDSTGLLELEELYIFLFIYCSFGLMSPPLVVDLISGAGAGLICSVLCAPLDVAKVRMQVQGSLGIKKYKGGVISTITKIYREEGIRGPFKGIGPALITAPLFWGVYWPLYGHLKPMLSEYFPNWSYPMVHLVSAISAGGVADVITNPFWVTRTRIQTLILHSEEHLSGGILLC